MVFIFLLTLSLWGMNLQESIGATTSTAELESALGRNHARGLSPSFIEKEKAFLNRYCSWLTQTDLSLETKSPLPYSLNTLEKLQPWLNSRFPSKYVEEFLNLIKEVMKTNSRESSSKLCHILKKMVSLRDTYMAGYGQLSLVLGDTEKYGVFQERTEKIATQLQKANADRERFLEVLGVREGVAIATKRWEMMTKVPRSGSERYTGTVYGLLNQDYADAARAWENYKSLVPDLLKSDPDSESDDSAPFQ